MQVIWTRHWGFSAGEAGYYGWRRMIHVGPLWRLVGKIDPTSSDTGTER